MKRIPRFRGARNNNKPECAHTEKTTIMRLSYETVKVVSIPDTRLGLLRYGLVFAIVIYVGVVELWALGGWLASGPVQGVIRFSLQQPTVDNCDPFDTSETTTPCNNDFSSVSTLPYCTQFQFSNSPTNDTNNTSVYKGNQYPCEIYEAINAQTVMETSLVAMTRAVVINQTLICDGDDHLSSSRHKNNNDNIDDFISCPHTYQETTTTSDNSTAHTKKLYIAEIERFTVLMDHAVTASKFCRSSTTTLGGDNNNNPYFCAAASSNFHGRLLVVNNNALCQEYYNRGGESYAKLYGNTPTAQAPCFIEPNRTSQGLDYFALDTLLHAAGISLDECSSTIVEDDNHSSCRTYRETGATLLVNIEWNDFRTYHGRVEPRYYYRVSVIGANYKLYIPYYQVYRQSRTLIAAHGIRVAVVLDGEFHQWDLLAFCITVTTALGLLAVSTTVVDSFMLYVLPEKERYASAKYETTSTGSTMSSDPAFGGTERTATTTLNDGATTNDNPNATNVSQQHDPAAVALTQPLLLDNNDDDNVPSDCP